MNPLDPEPKDVIEDRKGQAVEEPPVREIPDQDLATKKPPKKNPFLFFVWLAFFLTFALIIWGYSGSMLQFMRKAAEDKPFLQVTNRQMSVFLWQFPNLLRQNVKSRGDYLTGFDLENRVGIKAGYADQRVVAPPEVLFLYHTWDRLVREEYTQRIIPKQDFFEFLVQSPEWLPEKWNDAPAEYAAMVKSLDISPQQDLSQLSKQALPVEVRLAYQGWKNFFEEGDLINIFAITYADLKKFLGGHPHYARNYWINIVKKDYPDYLKSFTLGSYKDADKVPPAEIPPFVKVAIFNMIQADKKL